MEEHAKRQEQIREKTEELRKKIEELQRDAANRSLDRAGQQMQGAQQSLQQGSPQQSAPQEQHALDELRRAQNDLDEARRQMEDMQQEAALFRLETLLRTVLAEQEKINARTIALEVRRLEAKAFSRAELVELNNLGATERELAGRLDDVKKQLEEEKADVFGWVLDSIHKDLGEASTLLAREHRTDGYTQGVQADVTRKLKELIDSLQAEQARRRRQRQGGGGGGGGGRQPLVPPVAELKMIRTMQRNVNRKTDVYLQRAKTGESIPEAERLLLRRLVTEQGEIHGLTVKFVDMLKRLAGPQRNE
jgi:hypothetical protein